MKKVTFFIAVIFSGIVMMSTAQNIGISPNSSTPHPSAGLDIDFLDKGILIPRVSLVNTTSAGPVTDPATSLLVYNTASTGDVTPGYYFWNGTAWTRLSASIDGSGTANYLSKWTGSGTIGSSQVYDDGTNVGIGTATPGAKLEVAGRISQTSTGYSVFIGEGAGANDDLTNKFNVFIGYQSGNMNITGLLNTAIGNSALNLNTAGHSNTAVGSNALMFNSGSYNTANGMNSLMYNTTGEENSAIGAFALGSNTTGWQNTASGSRALSFNTTGSNNTADGSSALMANTTGYKNTATGSYSLYSNITGTENTSNGFQALYSNTSGEQNIGVGSFSLLHNTTGYSNTANGIFALSYNTTGCYNTSHGGWTLTTNTEGYFNSAFGYGADVASGNLNNATAIGAFALAGADNSLVLGSINGINGAPASVNVGIGTTTPTARLHVVGTVKVADGTQGANKVLTSDANGVASWQNSDLTTLASSSITFDVECFQLKSTVSTGTNPLSLAVSGNYSYVANRGSNTMTIYNVINPATPALIGSVNTGLNPQSVAVSGNYAYVANSGNNSMTVYNISNPASPLLAGLVNTGVTPYSIAVAGNYTYVTNQGSNTMTIYNVTNPESPVLTGVVSTHLLPSSVAVSGNYAYVANYGSGTMTIYDVTNPVSPTMESSVTSGINTRSVAVSGNYAYVVNQGSNTLRIYNVSNPASPLLTGGINTGTGPISVAVSGNYAYVANVDNNTLTTYNVSNPANPTLAGTVTTGTDPWSVAVSGNYAYVANGISNTMQLFQLSCPQNILMQDGNIVLVPETWSTSSENIFNANQGNVGIGTINPSAKLDVVGGNIKTNQQLVSTVATGAPLAVTSTTLVSNLNADLLDGSHASAFAPASGSSNYIRNGTTLQSSSNFNITGNGYIGGNVGIGTTSPTAKLDVTGGNIRTNQQLVSTVVTGTAPIIVSSTTSVSNLNADLLDGSHASAFATSAHSHTLTLTGDVTGSGSVTGSWATTLTNSGVTAGSYGTSGAGIPNITVDTKGRLTAASTRNLTPADIGAAPASGGINYVQNQTAIDQTAGFRITGDGIFNGGNVGIGTTTPSTKLDIVGGSVKTDNQFISTMATGTAPMSVTSSTLVSNLNADLLDSLHADGFIKNQTASDQAAGFRIAGNGIFNGGKIGIGTTTPTGNLQIDNTGDVTLAINADTDNAGGEADNPRIELRQDGGGVIGAIGLTGSNNALHEGDIQNAFYIVEEYSEGALQFGTNNQIKMTILPTGNIGIGTTSPADKLDVAGTVRAKFNLYVLSNNTSQRLAGMRHDGDDNLYVFNDNACVNGVYLAENGTSWQTFSDVRLKKDFEPVTDILDNFCKLNVTRFHMISDPDTMTKRLGFIAQEVQPLFPYVVCDGGDYLGLSYTDFGVLSVEAIKELRAEKDAEIAALKNENGELEKKLESLQAQISQIQQYLEMSSQKEYGH